MAWGLLAGFLRKSRGGGKSGKEPAKAAQGKEKSGKRVQERSLEEVL